MKQSGSQCPPSGLSQESADLQMVPAICEVLNIALLQVLGERGTQTVLLSGMVHPPCVNRELIQDGNYWDTDEQLSVKKCFSERKVMVQGKERVLCLVVYT